jgi:hypothetical protein
MSAYKCRFFSQLARLYYSPAAKLRISKAKLRISKGSTETPALSGHLRGPPMEVALLISCEFLPKVWMPY